MELSIKTIANIGGFLASFNRFRNLATRPSRASSSLLKHRGSGCNLTRSGHRSRQGSCHGEGAAEIGHHNLQRGHPPPSRSRCSQGQSLPRRWRCADYRKPQGAPSGLQPGVDPRPLLFRRLRSRPLQTGHAPRSQRLGRWRGRAAGIHAAVVPHHVDREI